MKPYENKISIKSWAEEDRPREKLSSQGRRSLTDAELIASSNSASKRGTTAERLRRRLRGDLDTIVAKALKKNPRERYASVNTMAEDLGRYLRHEPILQEKRTFVLTSEARRRRLERYKRTIIRFRS